MRYHAHFSYKCHFSYTKTSRCLFHSIHSYKNLPQNIHRKAHQSIYVDEKRCTFWTKKIRKQLLSSRIFTNSLGCKNMYIISLLITITIFITTYYLLIVTYLHAINVKKVITECKITILFGFYYDTSKLPLWKKATVHFLSKNAQYEMYIDLLIFDYLIFFSLFKISYL